MHVTYAPGSSVGNLNWIWHSMATDIDSALQSSQPLIEEIKNNIPQVPHASHEESYISEVTPLTKKLVLRNLYKELVGDCSASVNLSESERVAAVI